MSKKKWITPRIIFFDANTPKSGNVSIAGDEGITITGQGAAGYATRTYLPGGYLFGRVLCTINPGEKFLVKTPSGATSCATAVS